MPPRLAELFRRRSGWLTGAAFLALAPKCLLCLAAYAGLGAAVGLGGPEPCGAADSPIHHASLTLAALTLSLIFILVVLTRGRLVRPPVSQSPAPPLISS